ncbi:MAG: hypothetical protein AB7T63_03125 [Planctomycetota bacterium]
MSPRLLLLLPLLLLGLASPLVHGAWASETTVAQREIDQQELFVFEEGGARFDVTVERGPRRATRAGIEGWLRAAARAVAGLHGRFPVPQVRVVVKPGGTSRDPVIFGQAVRREEERLDLILCRTATDDELPGEWIAIHEMTHLAFPRIDRTDAWINEGFVTYYQEVLRTRAGFQSEPEGWGMLADGFARGATRGSGRSLAEESRLMQRTHGYWRVYWGGAAMALDMDLELRRRTGGKRTLDDVVTWWWRAFGARRGATRGLELIDAADRWLGAAILRPLADRHLARVEFADVRELFGRIGLAPRGNDVVYLDQGPLIRERTRIMRPGGR